MANKVGSKHHTIDPKGSQLDQALEDTFPASDPPSQVNPSIGIGAKQRQGDTLDRRIRERAEHLWRDAGRPVGGIDAFLDAARTLVAIEDNPKAGTLPNPMSRGADEPYGEPEESAVATENEGEFPTLTDQGDQVYPPRKPK
jgi:hypothetical protein